MAVIAHVATPRVGDLRSMHDMAETAERAPSTAADGNANGQVAPKPKGWEGQTFLVGEHIYVRGIEEGLSLIHISEPTRPY